MTPDQRAEITRVPDVVVERFVAQHDVAENAITIGNLERRDRAAVIDDRNFQTVIVREGIKINLGAVGLVPKCVLCYVHRLLKTRFASSKVSIEPTSYQRPGTFHT